jgi:hypothetical protein
VIEIFVGSVRKIAWNPVRIRLFSGIDRNSEGEIKARDFVPGVETSLSTFIQSGTIRSGDELD